MITNWRGLLALQQSAVSLIFANTQCNMSRFSSRIILNKLRYTYLNGLTLWPSRYLCNMILHSRTLVLYAFSLSFVLLFHYVLLISLLLHGWFRLPISTSANICQPFLFLQLYSCDYPSLVFYSTIAPFPSSQHEFTSINMLHIKHILRHPPTANPFIHTFFHRRPKLL